MSNVSKALLWRAACMGAMLVTLLASPAARAEPDEDVLGKSMGYPVGRGNAESRGMPYRVGSWSALDKVPGVLANPVRRAEVALPLPRAANPPEIRYRHRNIGYTLDDYLNRRRITGLLILKDGQIVAERYRYERKEDARFLSFSMAKSVTSLLIGAALERGVIASIDDPAGKYAKDLAGSAYGDTSIRHLLRMSSGLTFTERYDGTDDVARLSIAVSTGNPSVTTVLRGINDRHSAPGAKFVYASAETEVLGRVLTAASGRSMADLTTEWLWQPLGTEFDAFWCTARDRQEAAYFCFNAALRDWGRLGLMLARDGKVGDRQVIAREYLLDATDPVRQPAAFAPYKATRYFGYGYQFWLHPLKARSFAMQGVHGQTVYVQPSSGIVMVQTAVYAQASGAQDPDPYEERTSFWMGVLRSLGGDTTGY
ncbi:MAG: class C beta-lactamase-related serine hydrolase [Betaproteobacteria bacterium]|nr:class C beta-lactamase-related serine hydrolase [Betaproteobacteria bacterium]